MNPDLLWHPTGCLLPVGDTDAAVAAAVAGGGSLQGDPMDSPFGRMAFLTDPDGAVFALAGPALGRVTVR